MPGQPDSWRLHMSARRKKVAAVWVFGVGTVLTPFYIWVVLAITPTLAVSQTLVWWNTHWVRWALAGWFVFLVALSAFIWFFEFIFGTAQEKEPIEQRLEGLSFSDADVLMNFSLHHR